LEAEAYYGRAAYYPTDTFGKHMYEHLMGILVCDDGDCADADAAVVSMNE